VGAVSGTVLSFELGLLWPRFMERAGAAHRHAIQPGRIRFLPGSHLPRRLSLRLEKAGRRAHLAAGALVAVSGPQRRLRRRGERLDEHARRLLVEDGDFTDIDLVRASSAVVRAEALHMCSPRPPPSFPRARHPRRGRW